MNLLNIVSDFAQAYPKFTMFYLVFQVLAVLWAAVALYSWEKRPFVPPALVLEYFPGWDLGGYRVTVEYRPLWQQDYWRTAFFVLVPGVNLITVGFMMPFYAVAQVSRWIKDWRLDRRMRETRRHWC